MTTTTQDQLEGLGTYRFGWADSDVAGASARRGLSEEVVRDISAQEELCRELRDLAADGDMIICMGAGDITKWAAALPDGIRQSRQSK